MPATKKKAPKKATKTRAIRTPEIMCVRIKRYNPKRGNRLQRFMVFGYKFLEEANWYKVPTKIVYLGEVKDLREYLENVHQDNEDPESPMAFDVCTVPEMERINKHERDIEERKQFNLRRVGDPVDMTRQPRRSASERGTGRRDMSERGDLTLDDVGYNSGRRKFPRSMRSAAEEES